MAMKPWRPLRFGGDTGRFTRQQIQDAIRTVDERIKAARENSESPKASNAGVAARTRSRKT
jgi:hypothetical protein